MIAKLTSIPAHMLETCAVGVSQHDADMARSTCATTVTCRRVQRHHVH